MQIHIILLFIEFVVILIAAICFLSFQILNIAKKNIQNGMYRFEIKQISYYQIITTISLWIGMHVFYLLILLKVDIEYYSTIIGFFFPAILSACPKKFDFLEKKISYRISAYPLNSPGILSSYLENQNKLINKLKGISNGNEKFDEIKNYIQKFENYSDYFQPIDLIRIAYNTINDANENSEFDVLMIELAKNIKKAMPIDKAYALKMILSAKLPVARFEDIFSDIQGEIVKQTKENKEANNKIILLKIYCECIENIVREYSYFENNKKYFVEKYFVIFNELSSQQHKPDSKLVELACDEFIRLFPYLEDFIPSSLSYCSQDGLDGMRKTEGRFFSETKKEYSDKMINLMDKIKKSQQKKEGNKL